MHSGIRSSSLIVRSLPLGMESCFKQSEDSTNKDSRSIGFKLIIVLYIQQYRIHVYLFKAVPVILLITVKSIPFQRDCVYTYRTLYSVDRILEIYRLCYHCSFVQQHRAVLPYLCLYTDCVIIIHLSNSIVPSNHTSVYTQTVLSVFSCPTASCRLTIPLFIQMLSYILSIFTSVSHTRSRLYLTQTSFKWLYSQISNLLINKRRCNWTGYHIKY